MSQKLHIVSLENPYPPDYGGVMGIFNRIKALHQSGLEIHLHVFYHQREPRIELENYCYKVYYYRRDMRKTLLFSKYPFIVVSRNSKNILDNLLKINAPILFEGIHSCFYLNHPGIKDRIRLVRMHNVEHEYYHHLALAEKNIFKRWYLNQDSKKLEKFENVLIDCTRILSVVESDQHYFEKKFTHSELMPVFIDYSRFNFTTVQNPTIIYHGNLSVSENILAAHWLIDTVFSKLKYNCIIAGKSPAQSLIKSVAGFKNIQLIANPSKDNLDTLIQTAAVNVLPTFQATGIKLKLIDSLMQGKHCVVNEKMLIGTSLHQFCHIAETPEDFCREIEKLISISFRQDDFEKRKTHLKNYFNSEKYVSRIKELIKDAKD